MKIMIDADHTDRLTMMTTMALIMRKHKTHKCNTRTNSIKKLILYCRQIENELNMKHFDIKEYSRYVKMMPEYYEMYSTENEIDVDIASIIHDTSHMMKGDEIQKHTQNILATLVRICDGMQLDVCELEYKGLMESV
jgi:hypothetical protein